MEIEKSAAKVATNTPAPSAPAKVQRPRRPHSSLQGAKRENEKKVHPQEQTTERRIEPQRQARTPRKNTNLTSAPSVKVMFLGGLNEVGKNVTLFECGDDMFLLDCGMTFPDNDTPGIDLVIPDFTYIEKNAARIKGIVLTHGHEDHIGGLPYLLRSTNIPIYGTNFTISLVSGKLKEHNLLRKAKLHVVRAGSSIKLGNFVVELIGVNHSIPDAVGVAIHTPAGVLVHTGDFKIDCTPTLGSMIDLGRFAELGKQGVLALFSDSTNAERPGYTVTEQKVFASFDNLFLQAEKKRIIIASFASNINRVQQVITCAAKYGRKVAFTGRSMINYMGIACELGYLDVPEGIIIDLDDVNKFPREQVVLVTTGSQGESMSALSRMAYCDHRKVSVGPEDFVIISASPIPGNEKSIGAVINELMKHGCHVVYESIYEIHVSGHACQEELKLMLALTKPKYFIPVHGEQKHLRHHGALARNMGVPHKNIHIGDLGDCIELNRDFLKVHPKVQAGRVFVDGLGVGDVGNIVLRDRKHLSQDGLIVVVCTLDFSNGQIVSGPDVVSRGFVYVRGAEAMLDKAKARVTTILETYACDGVRDWGIIKKQIHDNLSRFFYEKTKRNPMIIPILMEI